MKDLIKKYSDQLILHEQQVKVFSLAGLDHGFIDGQIAQIKSFLEDLYHQQRIIDNQKLIDRFFLEEVVYAIAKENTDHYETLCRDFLKEFVNDVPLSEREREKHIKLVIGLPKEYFFGSEAELDYFFNKGHIPTKAELRQHKIQNIIS